MTRQDANPMETALALYRERNERRTSGDLTLAARNARERAAFNDDGDLACCPAGCGAANRYRHVAGLRHLANYAGVAPAELRKALQR